MKSGDAVRARAIAVVAVHGVADQPPRESARQIANLLTDLCPLGTYSTFIEEGIRVPIEPLRLRNDAPEPPAGRSMFEERNPDAIARHRRPSATAAAPAGPVIPPDVAFMADQLRDYEPGADVVFETVRLLGKRNQTGAAVHVYEAYWADLSRPSRSLVAFFLELYQLVLHLPSVGRNALDYARAAHDNAPAWSLFSRLHRWSIRSLTVFIVCLNLAMASLVPAILAPRLAGGGATSAWPRADVVATCALLGLAALVAVAEVLRRSRPVPKGIWLAAPFAAFALGCLCAWWLGRILGPSRLLVVEVWLVAAFVIDWALRAYQKMRPGARLTGRLALAATFVALVACLRIDRPDEGGGVQAVMRTIQLVDVALALFWGVHVVGMVVATLAGVWSAARSDRDRRRAAWQTVWTAQATLALSTAVFANLTLAFWDALFMGARRLVQGLPFRPIPMGGWLDCVMCMPAPSGDLSEYIQQTINLSATRAFIWTSVVLGVLLAVLVWSIFPSVVLEARPARRQPPDRRPLRDLGEWMTRGLRFTPGAVWMLPAFYLFVVAAGLYACYHEPCAPDTWSGKAISAAGATVLALFAARFWLPGASAVLDVILDVDNYLRQHPEDSTPRARIAARHASLLRFLVTPERSGQDYDAIVVIAHSQGSVITADLLRFLQVEAGRLEGVEKDPWTRRLAEKDLVLFTMGSPLRQLYARAFPWLYEWVRRPGPNRAVSPHPDDLGISRWVNAYRTGDYIGRSLWRREATAEVWDRRTGDPQDEGRPDLIAFEGGRCEEMCIGEGAHTHYWDHHGTDIAWELDRLIGARA